MLLPFHLCIFRILNDSPEITGSSSAQQCLTPFHPQVLPTFLSFPIIPQAESKHSPCRPRGFHIHQTRTHKLRTITSLRGAKQMSLPTQKVTASRTFSEWLVALIHTYKTQRRIRALLPPAHKSTDLRRKQLHTRRLHLAMVFAETPEFDELIWRPLHVWALQIKKHTQTQTAHQANKPRHPQQTLSFKNNQLLPSKPQPWLCTELPCCWLRCSTNNHWHLDFGHTKSISELK